MRRRIPIIITFVVGTALILAMFIPHTPFSSLDENLSVYFDIIAVFAFILGGGNLLRVHLTKIQKKKRDWQYSTVTVVGFVTVGSDDDGDGGGGDGRGAAGQHALSGAVCDRAAIVSVHVCAQPGE